MNFSPDINLDNPCSKNYNGALYLKYNEHPNKDKILCKGAVNFPSITLPSRDATINCILGSRAVKKFKLTNNGPIPVMYKFLWAGESIEIHRVTYDARNFTDDSELQINVVDCEFAARLCNRKENLEDRENGNGSSEIFATSASSCYDLRKTVSETSLAKALCSRVLNETRDKLRSILLPTGRPIEMSYLSYLEDPEIFALMESALKPLPPTRESLDGILDIVPHEGTILPHSSQYTCFIFHGTEPVRIKVVALCDVLQGPTELVNVTANADFVHFFVNKRIIDFNERLYGETCRSSFTLANRSVISLSYKINERNLISNAGKSGHAINALTVRPNKGTIDPLSSMEIEIEFQPTLLGAFEIELELQVAHIIPQIITVKGVTSYPQVYPCIPREDIFQRHSVELGYRAIQLLTSNYLAMRRQVMMQLDDMDDNRPWTRIPEWDEKILSRDLWDLITPEEIFPSVVEIEMAIDRLLATRFTEENASVLMKHSIPHKKAVLPRLYVPEYVIDMGFVAIDLTARYSTTIINYGPWSVEIAIKKLDKKQLENSGIVVQFKKVLLKVGETAPLVVTWRPTSAGYTERSTKEQHTIHLEVSRGPTIPIIIKSVVTYPFVSLNTRSLDFQTVIVGECLMMSVLLKNEGFINCCWEAKMTSNTRKRQKDCQFHLSYKPEILSPGRSNIINVYFKPRKTCYATAKVKIIVDMGLEEQTITLRGHGTERKLQISESDIDFPPSVPFTGVREKIFTIENVCEDPVEFFWHHLDSLFPEEERAAEVLIRYYGVKEILLPPRKLGERMPTFLMEFYNSLVSEMEYALSARTIEEGTVATLNEQSPEDLLSEPIWLTKNPEEIQLMLICYVEALREELNFSEEMKDPVKELFDSLEKSPIPEPDPTQPAKKVCIIFHGAPFTEYQEAACRSAKVLHVPLLCIDNAMIEGIALGDNQCSVELRRIIDDAYQEYLSELEKYEDVLGISLHRTEITRFAEHSEEETVANEISPESPKSSKMTKSNLKTATKINRHSGSDVPPPESIIPLERGLAKILREQDLKFLDPVSLYEFKIQTILQLQRNMLRYATKSAGDKVGEKSTEKNQDDTFLGFDVHLLAEVLRERLSLSDFKKGFVLQTLNNVFIRNEITTLLVLLDIVGHLEYSLFVTFINSMDKYIRKMNELRELEARRLMEETNKRIQEIDEMWLSEYELLAEDEKKFYLESTLPIKKQETLQRRIQFLQQMTELRKRKKSSRKSSKADIVKNRETNKITKDEKSNNQKEKFQIAEAPVSKKAIQNSKELKKKDDSKEKQEMSEELENIAKAMNNYHSNLSVIENIIKNWDPLKKDTSLTTNGKIVKTDKPGDKGPDISEKQTHANEFHIWYVNAMDPWDRIMYDLVVNQMSENSLAKEALHVEISPEPDLQPKRYHILKPSYIRKRDDGSDGTYEIVSLSAMLESTLATVDSSSVSAINNQENHVENTKRRERSHLVDKTEDAISLNASTIESKDTVGANASTIMLEETKPKPRWILQSGESQKFKIRYQPEEMGTHQCTYALSVIDGGDITYNINVRGIADLPRLDMNPNAVFSKVEKVKIADIHDPAYFSDIGAYDFGSLLAFREDKSEHRRDTEFKFCNTSKIDAEVCFYLKENIPDIFILKEEKLYIPAEQCRLLKISAGVTKPGLFTDEMYICVTNNPHVDTFQLRCSGSKLDIALEDKQVSFGQVLLYRRDFLTSVIRNRSPIQIFWRLVPDESLNSQISFAPNSGIVKAGNDQEIEFCYHASKIGTVDMSLTFDAFFHENDVESIFTETLALSGETYDVAVDINHANPIDLKCVKVGFPTSANFTINNRGNYEVKYVILLEGRDKHATIVPNLPARLKEDIEISPASGSIKSQEEKTVEVDFFRQFFLFFAHHSYTIKCQKLKEIVCLIVRNVTFLPKNEITLKECPILQCNLLDTNKQAVVIAKIPLTVSLVAYYTRFRVYPYPEINFTSIGVCTEKTMHLHVENIGQFPLHYFIQETPISHPSVAYMTQVKKEDTIKKDIDKATDTSSRKNKNNMSEFMTKLQAGPFTVTKTEGNVQPGKVDTVTIKCYPEFVGSEEEQILILVPDSVPEDKSGKLVTLSVNSYLPRVDFYNLDAMFHENYIVERIQDFVCPKEVGAHTVFAREERCLYFRQVMVCHTHKAYFMLHNRNMIPADVELTLHRNSPLSATFEPDTFVVTPERERIPPMSRKRFAISFNPTLLETYHAVFGIEVEQPSHLKDEKFLVKLMGQACVPEVTIVEPPNGKRERAVLNFGRTLVNDSDVRSFAFRNVGLIPAKVIVEIIEIDEDPKFLFTLGTRDNGEDSTNGLRDYGVEHMSNNRCVVVHLTPGETASVEVKFSPWEIGKYKGLVRLFVADNPYENLTIDLKAEVYAELIVLKDLKLVNAKSAVTNERRELNSKLRRSSSRPDSVSGDSSSTLLSASLIYRLDFGCCFVNKIYRKNFKIVNKSADRYLRFQWDEHPNVVFTPSIGHLKGLTCKEIVATFLSSEPANYVDTHLDCTIYAIELVDLAKEPCWDDRETEVRWVTINSDDAADEQETNAETYARKVVEPVHEPSHEIVPGTTKCIQVLLNAIVAFSKYSCLVKEINFKDTLMFQTREYVFTFSNTGTVDVEYTWWINMDEQYPIRRTSNYSRPTLRPRGNTRSVTNPSARPTHVIVEIKPPASVGEPSDLFSSNAGLTERSSDSWLESDDLPFGIYPEKGILPPGESIQCTLRFSPVDVFDYKAYLTCKAENLDPELTKLVIPIAGRSLLPYCHFDVPESNYLSDDRRDAKLPGPIDYQAAADGSLPADTRVIEFNVVGIGETHVRKVRMINPTSDDYHFAWNDRTCHAEGAIPNFHCVLSEGIAERGKQVEFAFAFLAERVGTLESFWLFSIEKYSLECLFLLVAIVREPSVYCPLVHLRMRPTVLGTKVRESISIVNEEEFQLLYEVARESLYSEGRLQNLKVTPMSGILNARSEQVLWLEYQPTLAGEFQFLVKCAVKKMKAPLTILVTTITYDIVVSVTYVDRSGRVVRLDQDQENIVDCGRLMLKVPVVITFEITNSSEMTIYYFWDLGMTPEIISRNTYTLAMSENQGDAISESRVDCRLTVTGLRKTVIKSHRVLLKISRGPTYRLILKATANKPALEFSFNHYDFGPCYVQDAIAAVWNHVDLRITNFDSIPYMCVSCSSHVNQDQLMREIDFLRLECKFEEKPHISVILDALSEKITARSNIVVPIKFRPLERTRYRDELRFTIDSAIEKKITIMGEGIAYKVHLVNPCDKSVDLGNLPINKTTSKRIPVINEGRAALELRFDLTKRLSGFEPREGIQPCSKRTVPGDGSKLDRTRASMIEMPSAGTNEAAPIQPDLSEVLEVEPTGSIVLQPGKIVNVFVKYKPTRRIRPFVTQVAYQTASTVQPLFALRGSCIGREFRLSKTRLSFGFVHQGCLEETKIALLNTGDIGARFKWNTSKLPWEFSIAPAAGYCSPGMSVNFIISFRPTRHDSLIEGDALLEIEKYGALGVRITGGCRKLPDPIDILFFTCRVREKLTKTLIVENDTGVPWTVKPEVTGDYFTADEILRVPPNNSASCAITYAPLVMNSDSNPHKGTLLLRLPNEKALVVYVLQGLSVAPQILRRITRQFPAKTRFTELLPVYNWTNRQQRFDCKIENLDDEETAKDFAFTFVGNTKIDVPANNQRDYRAEFHSYKESKCNFKVTFTNQENEYQFYELQYNITRPEEIESIKLFTTARIPVYYTLKLDNPLKQQRIVYNATCQHPYVTIYNVPKTVAPTSSETIRVEYYPVHPSDETVVKLDVHCEELGLFPYELRLRAAPVHAEETTRVVATLGSCITFSLPISNFTKESAVFAIKVDKECFVAPRKIEVPPLKSASCDVTYEPSDIENVFATLTATSEIAGEFIFPLVGMYSLPMPRGPYVVRCNAPALIPFKNIFRDAKSFELVLDDPQAFTTTTSLLNVKQKQVVDIAVRVTDISKRDGEYYQESENYIYPITGKLLVYCTDPKLSHIKWTYYLRGVRD
ncbi:PREDICTED: hydrocephalus-inducing protein homolog [Dinoponera quadriceps]|uniref:Hydrocephalus-inducing protein homolog n=1 Tax=Dinoponera quadriceps TaxID=609295 RepID=A0A6P3XHX6_DINQU|nr:PREDICTED: hydrocephalus-inducing protein homolog [Dinoponera quadriceps]